MMMVFEGLHFRVYLEYFRKLHEFHKDHPLATDKLEIKKEMFSDYQLKIAKDYNISISNIKAIVPNFFNK